MRAAFIDRYMHGIRRYRRADVVAVQRRRNGVPVRAYRGKARGEHGVLLLKCCDCGDYKPKSEYSPRPDRPDGVTYDCRECKARKKRHRRK